MTKAAEVHDVDAGVSGLRRRREAGLTEKLGIVEGRWGHCGRNDFRPLLDTCRTRAQGYTENTLRQTPRVHITGSGSIFTKVSVKGNTRGALLFILSIF